MTDFEKLVLEKLDTMDKRFDVIDDRLDAMDKHFDAIDKRLDVMDKRLDGMDKRFDAMGKRLDGMDERMDNMQKDITRIKITLENDVSPSIKMLSELQLENSKRLILLEKQMQEVTDNMVIDDVLQGLKYQKQA